MCSATHRLQPIGDLPCSSVGGVCVVRDGGSLALCERARDASTNGEASDRDHKPDNINLATTPQTEASR